MMQSSTLLRFGLLAMLLAGLSCPAQAQVQERVYPPAEPSKADTLNGSSRLNDKQQFANQSVLGQGPSTD